MKILNISGGATKIPGLYAKCKVLLNEFGYSPDVITGVSSGSLLSLPLALGKFEELDYLVLSFKPSDIFDRRPFNDKGKVTLNGVLRIVSGKPSFGTQNNLVKTLSRVVSEKDFQEYKNSTSYPDVYVGVTNYNLGSFEVISVRSLTYQEYLMYTLASCSIPYAVEAVKINDNYYYDGGVLHHTCSPYMLRKFSNDRVLVSHNVTVYSRPETPDMTHHNFNQIDISQVFMSTSNLQVSYISVRDQLDEKEFCINSRIPIYQSFCPKVLTSMYDSDPSRIQELFNRAFNEEILRRNEFVDFLSR